MVQTHTRDLRIFGIITLLTLLLVFSTISFAATPGGANVTLEVDKGPFPTPAPASVNVTAGNITLLNLSTIQQTFRWVGLYGNVTGSIKLGNSQSDVLYAWQSVGKYVYASQSNSVNWLAINASNTSGVITEYPFLSNGTDNYSITFANTGVLDSEIVGYIPNVPLAQTYNSTGAAVWDTLSLTDGTSTIFTGVVNPAGGNSFSNEDVNYQMIIPENGLYQNTAPTEYYLWVELV